MSDKMPPPVPLLLGAAGLVPFAALSLMLVAGIDAGYGAGAVRGALAAYAAVILSFLGGIRWGLAVALEDQGRARREYVISVIPSLLAWGALALPEGTRLGVLAALVVALGLLDYGLVCRNEAPEWFGRLRLALSAGAGLALAAGAAA